MKPYIPQPCHEDWNTMAEKEKGRHCDVCAKVVVDFTKMNDEEMIDYLHRHQYQKTCGHFRTEQLLQTEEIIIDITAIPEHTSFKSLFFACLLIAFSSLFLISCTSCMMGKVKMKEDDKDSTQTIKVNQDSIPNQTGFIEMKPLDSTKAKLNKTEKKTITHTSGGSISCIFPAVEPLIDTDEISRNSTIEGKVQFVPINEDTIEQKTMGKPVVPKQK